MDESARKRVEIIMKVNCGLMTATQAAKELQVSRKTYYKWEKKGLEALLNNVTDKPAGRPEKKPDPSQAELEQQLAKMKKENELLRKRMKLKDIMKELEPGTGRDKKK